MQSSTPQGSPADNVSRPARPAEEGEVLRHADANGHELDSYIVGALDRALEDGSIHVCYQPIVRTLNGKLTSVEALARWDDPKFGSIPPKAFVPALESSRTITRLDRFVIRSVLRSLRERIDAGEMVVPVAVNLSQVDFQEMDPCDFIVRSARDACVPPRLLRVEITEASLADDEERVGDAISRLRESGFQVWVDDFGVGYSSLGMLADHDFDGIKLDASLIGSLGRRSKSIITSVVKMARTLGCHTLAEGVERADQLRFLHDIGCEAVQGYFYGKPQELVQLVESCRRESLETESADEAAALDQADMLSFAVDKPFAVLRVDEDSISACYSNEAFRITTTYFGLTSDNPAEELVESISDRDRAALRRIADKTESSDDAEYILLKVHDRHMRIGVTELADTGSYKLIGVSPTDIASGLGGSTLSDSDFLLTNVLLTYEEAYLLDYTADTCTAITRHGTSSTAGNVRSGIAAFAKDYSERRIHRGDRQRFLTSLDQKNVFPSASPGSRHQSTQLFRCWNEQGMYQPCEFTTATIEDTRSRQALLCMKSLVSAIPSIVSDEAASALAAGEVPPVPDAGLDEQSASNARHARVDRTLNDTLASALEIEDTDEGIRDFIRGIGYNYDAERTYIFEENGDGSFTNTYEWCAEGIEPEIDFYRTVRDPNLSDMMEPLFDSHIFIYRDVAGLRDTIPYAERVLEDRGVRSAIFIPLGIGGRRIGFFGMDNPPTEILATDGSALITTAQFISIMIRNRDVVGHLDYLSLRDALTGILNRRGLQKYMRSVRRGINVVLVYGDLNNLKRVNDTQGHDAGDEFIKQAGLKMLDIAGRGHVFRIGGDEFVMSFELKDGEDPAGPVERVRAGFDEAGISIALGYSYARTPIYNIDLILSQADRDMYENKQLMHASRSEDEPID